MEPAISFKNITKTFSNSSNSAVDHVSLDIQKGEFVTLLGSSGSGKTTLLKMVNRLYEPDDGTIELFGQNIKEQNPMLLRRKIGYVIQQIGLFPHMTIAENIAVVPKLLKWDKPKIKQEADDLLELVGLAPAEYKDRYPSQLSGGQQQRVGLARALVVKPDVMLLDEPFGAIDAINRLNLQNEILRIHDEFDTTFLFVTHDMNEAFKLGDRVVVMNEGKVCQYDTPREIVKNPKDPFVESLILSVRNQERIWEEYQ